MLKSDSLHVNFPLSRCTIYTYVHTFLVMCLPQILKTILVNPWYMSVLCHHNTVQKSLGHYDLHFTFYLPVLLLYPVLKNL